MKQDLESGTGAEKFIKNESDFPMDPNVPPFVPSNLPESPEILRPEPFFSSSQYVSPDISATMREIVNLQAKQAELSSMIINQQKTTHLPVKEPPIFSGDPFEYPAFITAFDSIISANVPSDRDRLFFLNKYTKDKANEVVKGFLAMSSDSAYKEARKLLDHRFGNPVHVAEAYKSSLRKWPQISDGNSSGLQEFSDFLVRCEEAMKTMNSMGDLDSTQTLLKISAKLPCYSGVKWCRQAHELQTKTKKIITFSDFEKFVKEEAELAKDPIFSPDALKKERNKTLTVNQPRFGRKIRPKSKDVDGASGTSLGLQLGVTVQSFLATGGLPMESKIASEKSYQPCPLCEGQHSLVKCSSFLKKSVDQRSDVIREKGLCYGCFKRGHMSAGCRDRFTCEECGRRHHTLLHGVKPKSSNPQPDTKAKSSVHQPKKKEPQYEARSESKPAPESSNSNAISAAHSSVPGNASLITNCRIVLANLFHKANPEKQTKVYALLDDASDTTFVTTQVQEKLGIEGVQTSFNLSTMLGREVLEVERIDGLMVQRIDGRVQVELPKAYARESIPSRKDQIPTPEVADQWPHLQRIRDKIPPYEKDAEIGLLIGCNCPKAIKPKEVIHGSSEDPYAVRTLLGWSIVGPVATSDSSLEDHALNSTCHRTLARERVPGDRESRLSFVLKGKTKELINPTAINQMFELDFSDHNSGRHGLSKEDRRFLEIVEQGIHQCEGGHYELPFAIENRAHRTA